MTDTLLKKCQVYFSCFDGIPKDISDISHLFDDVYSDDFVYQVETNHQYYTKDQMKKTQANLLSLGSKATILLLKDIGNGHIEYKFQMVNDLIDVIVHNIGYVKENKLIKCVPMDQASYDSISKVRDVSDLIDAANNESIGDSISKILHECAVGPH